MVAGDTTNGTDTPGEAPERVAGGSALVSLQAVSKSFGENLVLDGIDLEVPAGSAVVIAGPSGSGKSTMLRCVNGLESIDSGTIRFGGAEVDPADRSIYGIRAEIGMVFQQFNLFPHMTVAENITLGPLEVARTSRGEARERAARATGPGRDPGEGGRVSRRPLGRSAAAGGDRASACG